MRLRCLLACLAVFQVVSSAISAERIDESAVIQKLAVRGVHVQREKLPNHSVEHRVQLIGSQYKDADLEDLFEVANLSHVAIQSASITDTGAIHLAKIERLTHLRLSRTQISDAGLQELAKLKNLKFLSINDLRVTDAGVKSLTSLDRLTTLCLRKTQITDECLADIGTLTRLRTLILSDNKITDHGLKSLTGLKNLQVLNLQNTQITDRGREFLKTQFGFVYSSTNGYSEVWTRRVQPTLKLLADK